MATIGSVDGVPILDKINKVEDKIKNRFLKRDPNVAQINETQKEAKQEQNLLASWDLRNWTKDPSKFISNMNINFSKQPMKQKSNDDHSL